jgi:hypothetical protein
LGQKQLEFDIATVQLIFGSTVQVSSIEVPVVLELEQNYPNPFNPMATNRYSLLSSTKVNLTLYDLLGREISTLLNEEQSAGWKEVR